MSTKDYGCFFCDGKSTEYDGICPKCNKPINISTNLLGLEIGIFKTVEILGRGFYGWTVKGEDNYQPFALKIIPTRRLRVRAKLK